MRSMARRVASNAAEICSPEESSISHLPFRGPVVDFGGLGDQVIRGVSLGRDHHYHIIALLVGRGDDIRHIVKAFGILYGGAAELLYNQCHYTFFPSSRPKQRAGHLSKKHSHTGMSQAIVCGKAAGGTYSITICAPWGAAERISTRQPVIPLSSRWVTQLRPKAWALSASIIAMMVGPAPLT